MNGNEVPTRQMSSWTVPERFPPLEMGEIHIWRLVPEDISNGSCELDSLLSPEEMGRASRFRFREHREQYARARGALRWLLGRYLRRAAQEIEFTIGPFGKPALAGGELSFNVSHSKGLTLIGFAPDMLLGVDVEQVRADSDLLEIANSHFCASEYQKLLSAPPMDGIPAFFRCWTRKEAFLKAEGTGLSRALDAFEVTLLDGEPASLIGCAWDHDATAHWSLQNLEPLPGYLGAIAFKNQPGRPLPQLRYMQWNQDIQL